MLWYIIEFLGSFYLCPWSCVQVTKEFLSKKTCDKEKGEAPFTAKTFTFTFTAKTPATLLHVIFFMSLLEGWVVSCKIIKKFHFISFSSPLFPWNPAFTTLFFAYVLRSVRHKHFMWKLGVTVHSQEMTLGTCRVMIWSLWPLSLLQTALQIPCRELLHCKSHFWDKVPTARDSAPSQECARLLRLYLATIVQANMGLADSATDIFVSNHQSLIE